MMPLPLKPGYNFNYGHFQRPPYFEMSAAEAYTDFYGLSYIINGDALIYSPEGNCIMHAGDISFTPKNIYYRSSYLSDKPREFILIKFTDSMVADLIKVMDVDNFNDLLIGRPTVTHLSKASQEKVLAILREMETEWDSYNKYSELILKGLLNRLLLICLDELFTANEKRAPWTGKKPERLIDAIDYMKAHLSESPSLQDTAKYINVSASYLSKLFINRLHTSYSTFMLNEKLLYAQKLLINSEMSMTEVAANAGFSSNSYFSDCFKRNFGISPLQFRKSVQR